MIASLEQFMNVSESIALWNMKQPTDANIMYNERFINEIRFFSQNKDKLYDIVYKMDDGIATQDEIDEAEKCICEMNACLRSAHELYLYGIESNIDYSKNNAMVLAHQFVKNYAKGYYDKNYDELCNHFQEKILKSYEL